MNYLPREKAKELIQEIGFSKFFIDVIDGRLDSPISIYFGCPTLYYLSDEEQAAYNLGDILPLWEDAGGYMQYAYDIERKDYIIFDIEDGDVSSRYTWDELIKSVIDTLIEHEYDEHENLEETISAVKFLLADLNIGNFDKLAADIQSEWENP
ncbi:hypothetical protein [Gallaecimonas xiamenensis]|uniref:Uncharacterized protein n=1 Tax=Gallaecimonas xiamenensis 3-C-1 TaxID=745411 RepID=K2JFL8_9GAMM|nr:hypothetical protein [Gallaecimonas xiamenensis]EKE69449.1 hypothetical protein B3C1_15097 [Gallaecimonas xiamenensis 3-C-1]